MPSISGIILPLPSSANLLKLNQIWRGSNPGPYSNTLHEYYAKPEVDGLHAIIILSKCVELIAHVIQTDVEWSVYNDPRGSLVTSGLRERSFVRDVIIADRNQVMNRYVTYSCMLT